MVPEIRAQLLMRCAGSEAVPDDMCGTVGVYDELLKLFLVVGQPGNTNTTEGRTGVSVTEAKRQVKGSDSCRKSTYRE
jgi:hypothetical protein